MNKKWEHVDDAADVFIIHVMPWLAIVHMHTFILCTGKAI